MDHRSKSLVIKIPAKLADKNIELNTISCLNQDEWSNIQLTMFEGKNKGCEGTWLHVALSVEASREVSGVGIVVEKNVLESELNIRFRGKVENK